MMLAAVLVTAALSGWSILSSHRLLHPAFSSLPARRPATARSQSLVLPSGESLEVWIFQAEVPCGVVVGCHGYRGSRLQLTAVADALQRRGFTTILYDRLGHGARAGYCRLGRHATDEVGEVLRWLSHDPGLAELSQVLLGWPMGAAVACQAARDFAQVHAVVADSVYARLFPVIASTIRRQYHLPATPWAWLTWAAVQARLRERLARWDPIRLAAVCRQPLLLIHGGQDIAVPMSDSHELARRWQGPTEQWIDPAVGHVGLAVANLETYVDRIVSFLTRWLDASPS